MSLIFNYLGSSISNNGKIDEERLTRVGKAVRAFWALSKIWDSKLHLRPKTRLYNGCVISILLYGGETWKMRQEDEMTLDMFDSRCLRNIRNVRWYDFISNTHIREWTNKNNHPLS